MIGRPKNLHELAELNPTEPMPPQSVYTALKNRGTRLGSLTDSLTREQFSYILENMKEEQTVADYLLSLIQMDIKVEEELNRMTLKEKINKS